MGIISEFKSKIKSKMADHIDVPTLYVSMMGPRSVGKTTVMTSIFVESTSEICKGSTVSLSSLDPTTTTELINYKHQLENAVYSGNASNLPASSSISRFVFGLGLAGRKPSLHIEVRDFPGEYLTSKNEEDKKDVAEFMSSATVILIAIDTPFLMEAEGAYNDNVNKIGVVSDYIKNNPSVVKDKLVLFVPLKCERYFHDGRMNEVSKEVREAYADLITFFGDHNIASFVTPILTLGGIELDRVDTSVNPPSARYRLYGTPPSYKPLFCSQPLFYLLTYMRRYYEWTQNNKTGVIESFKKRWISFLKDDKCFYEQMLVVSKYLICGTNGYIQTTTNSIFK